MSAIAQPRPAPPRTWAPGPVLEATTAQGHRIVLVPAPGRRSIALELVMDAGAAMDTAGREGMAAIAAKAGTEGTKERDARAWQASMDGIGSACWAGVTASAHRMSLTTPQSELEHALALVGESLDSTAPREGTVERLIREACATARQSDLTPATRALRELRARVHGRLTRMRLPLSGTEQTLANIEPESVEHLRARSTAKPITVVLSGDIGLSTAVRAVERRLGAPTVPGHIVPPLTDVPGRVRSLAWVSRDDLTQTQLAIGGVAIDGSHPDWSALRVAVHCLAGSLGSRVDHVLRETLGITYGVRGGLHPRAGDGLLVIAGGVQANATATAVHHILEVFAEAIRTGLTDDEVLAARTYLAGSAAVRLAAPRPIVEALADTVEAGLPATALETRLAALAEVTTADASAALARWVDPSRLSLSLVGPESARSATESELGVAFTDASIAS